ncbi:MAG: YjfB family protein [Oscillospiraceae bacterium]|nr:YjfB family protein [Oscillospiraceae bacterium]
MDLVNSIAEMSMTMSAVKTQQSVEIAVMKKTMDVSTEMVSDLLDAMSVPSFPGENGSLLNVRA